MPEWYDKLINKFYSDLTLFDVTRMLMQNVYIDLAIEKAKDFLTENPLCGEYYDGHLLEIISHLDISYLEKDRNFYKNLILKVCKEIEEFDGNSAEEKQKFTELLNKFKTKISENINE